MYMEDYTAILFIYLLIEQVFYPHSFTWGRIGTCVKGKFDALARQSVRQAAKA